MTDIYKILAPDLKRHIPVQHVYYLIIMAIVAVAGGTGGLGRSITQAIAKTGKHSVFVLSREACLCPST
jgi:FlaA1/EpsC-like NDP-sugar epimerase